MRIVPGIVFHRLPPPPKPSKKDLADKAEALAPAGGPFDVHIGTFNVLGSQHSVKGGDKPNYPPASVRTARTADLIAQHGVRVLGTQELQDDQLRDLQARTGFAAYPGFSWGTLETDNSILYDPDLYEFVSGSKFTITFVGRPRPQPILRLRDRGTGREFYVVNTHPSPGGGRALAERRRAQAITVGVIKQLKASGLPVFATGDMNDRQEFYCQVVTPAQMTAPNGGSTAGGCHPPPMPMPVDWVVGSGATWSSYWRDVRTTEQKISDHIFVSALAHVG
nr:endonuclease/exonuclease/phosphatase family protein [Nocardioides luti]